MFYQVELLHCVPMAKDFSGQNLRGRSFKGENLKGANFRDADIRGTNFVEADLAGADFRSTRAGLQRRWWLFLLGVCLSTTILSGLLISFYNYLVFLIFNSNASEILAGAVGLTFVVIF
ncbi:MAG: pentapeptide repeat-containing protein, partial [Cyanobacteria bacterium P01_E01_bin.45]